VKRLLVICIVAYLALASPACSKKQQEVKAEKPPKPVQVGEVTLGTVERTLTAPGSIVPARDVWISAEVSGRIVAKHVTEGQRVYVTPNVPADEQTTNLIASVDAADYERRLDQADATLKVAEAGLAQFTATQNRLADEIARKRPLHERKIISDKDWDDLVTRKEETDAQVALYNARVEEAQQAVEIAASNVAKTNVRSPLDDALVAHVAFDQGEFVTLGQPLVRIVNLDTMWVDVEVGESRLAQVKPGQHATFTVPAYPGEHFDGTVDSISPAGDPASRNFLVRLAVENADHRLKGGMFAVVEIPVNTRRDVALVPKSAVKQEGKFRYIFLVEGSKAVKRRIDVGSESGDSIEVLDQEIKPGLKIVVAGVENLADGDRITTSEAAE
jgi:membrane fusion protein (multidrug efflux system)